MKKLILISLISFKTYGLCVVQTTCGPKGCGPITVCDNSLDLPSMNLPSLDTNELMPVQPLQPLALPPLGTTYCGLQYINGKFVNVCK